MLFLLAVFLLTIPSLCAGSDLSSSSQSQQTLMQTSQYHFVPNGSSFQYSLASWQEGADSMLIDQVTVQIGFQVLSPSPRYNFIVLYTDSTNLQPYVQFNCYVRAVNEGLTQLMDTCNFTQTAYPVSNNTCNSAIQQASSGGAFFTSTTTFFNCTDTIIYYNISAASGVGPLNGTLLFIIDNSGLLGSTSSGEMRLILLNVVVANVNVEEKAKFYLFVGLTAILIAIMIVIAVALNCKIIKVDRELKACTQERIKAE